MAILYRHIRLDKNQPFYIGIGNEEKRAYDKSERNNLWRKIVNKAGYKVIIVLDGLTWEEACKKEQEFIALYGRKDNDTGILANLTDGGEGVLGLKAWNKGLPCLEHVKKALSEKMTGSTPWNKGMPHSPDSKLKMSKVKLSKKNIAWNKGLLKVNGISNAKTVLDTVNGIYYESAKEASNFLGFKHSTLKQKLNGRSKNNTNLIYA